MTRAEFILRKVEEGYTAAELRQIRQDARASTRASNKEATHYNRLRASASGRGGGGKRD